MARKKTVDTTKLEIKKLLRDKKLIIGTDRVVKHLKTKKLSKIFLAKNVSQEIKRDIAYYGKLAGVEVIQLKYANDELGELCNKPFFIAVLGVK
jgi:ribosomal protein L30E